MDSEALRGQPNYQPAKMESGARGNPDSKSTDPSKHDTNTTNGAGAPAKSPRSSPKGTTNSVTAEGSAAEAPDPHAAGTKLGHYVIGTSSLLGIQISMSSAFKFLFRSPPSSA